MLPVKRAKGRHSRQKQAELEINNNSVSLMGINLRLIRHHLVTYTTGCGATSLKQKYQCQSGVYTLPSTLLLCINKEVQVYKNQIYINYTNFD